ncbi:MAG: acyl-ACP--UDP-N-acetylglucosamine O-acyltransferase [Alphaproteobacteria bacterium]|jgi:UDP-N-acetylglucosamine acyltransferase
MTFIHPTAIVEEGAKIGENVTVGPFCIVGKQVELKDGVNLMAHVWVGGDTVIGENTEVGPFAVIGHKPQHKKCMNEPGKLVIGKNNVIREHVTMHPGTPIDNNITIVGDGGLFMVGTHVAHDCIVGDNVIMANNATLGGHVKLGDWAIVGGLSAVHQFTRIGAHAMIGGLCAIMRDVVPYALISGSVLEGINIIGLKRRGFSLDVINKLRHAVAEIFDGEGTMSERVDAVAAKYAGCEAVMEIVEFMKDDSKRRGYIHPAGKLSVVD